MYSRKYNILKRNSQKAQLREASANQPESNGEKIFS
jgi:hypothetical protein